MYYIRDIIEKKRRRIELTDDEIRFFIFSYFKNEITEGQAASLITLFHINGLSKSEMSFLINAISETGDELELYRLSNKITDIHSLGGISDKTILILLSIIHSLGFESGKIIGRELGMEDRLLSLKGYKLEDNIENFKNNISNSKICILKSIKNLAPIENKLYKLRHEIACDNNIQLIAISIMSQKMALGFKNIVFEITYGKDAYVKTLSDAKLLSNYLIDLGRRLNRNVACYITKLNQPIGKTFGNIIELQEIYDFLSGNISKDLENYILDLGSIILTNSGLCKNLYTSKKLIQDSITTGKAKKSFETLLTCQGGDIDILNNKNISKHKIPVTSEFTGLITEIDINHLRMLSLYLNSIRKTINDTLDIGAGIEFNKKVGDYVEKGGILLYIYTNDDTKIIESVNKAKQIFKIKKRFKK